MVNCAYHYKYIAEKEAEVGFGLVIGLVEQVALCPLQVALGDRRLVH